MADSSEDLSEYITFSSVIFVTEAKQTVDQEMMRVESKVDLG
jgi:hypothetical protein